MSSMPSVGHFQTCNDVLDMTNVSANATGETFLRKLHRILTHESALVVGWDVCGTKFTVKSTAKMEASILPHYFRSTGDMTFATFRKQLVAHGFSVVGQAQDSETFEHPEYTRSRTNAVALSMKRRRLRQPKISASPSPIQQCQHNRARTATSDNLWQLLATVCSVKGNPLFDPPSSHEAVNTFAVDGWTELATPAVVCL
ncbi:hypothetical protein H310_06106 [Aphanomyces invadans]|uniref:HSF-type DNA-binding domain-containing protein n=1 Tax=Aphanomyces invadans TaxID=157072 RepID=A0A024U9S7_9STRA|nr:hypothetical protein H310_06106 [Aphanomyces invadans]ETW02647.1 hypothetical protein H310_06106 [Aphanomyces invadans]|eukprot:XP_008869252.1 hypothetical protein H310_06106 [Aphanomyces invadans]